MAGYKDQHGRSISLDELIRQMSESILANLMVFELSGISRDKLKIIVGVTAARSSAGVLCFRRP
jgi:hypothetical protein